MPHTPAPKAIPITISHVEGKGGGYVEVPRWWIDKYFSFALKLTNGQQDDRLPGSFWKYTFYLWRWISIPRSTDNKYHSYISLDQFPVRSDAGVQWTWAYSHSGVMTVELGRWTNQNDRPTQFLYNPTTSVLEWECFFKGTAAALFYFTKMRNEYRRKNDLRAGSNTAAWCILLAREIDRVRLENNLPATTSQQWIEERIAAKECDSKLVPVFECRKVKRYKNETDEDYDFRLASNDYRDENPFG